ncbi:deoxyribose-phosphate aldolase [Haloflavibacter putidus]|uniref:Deoxyribose-phosphate aldolase n=1 Tax=Haloflavibacter putidus TaxID=2576776 RepID=A0A507ZYM8_9FLAO|nr:deoxyribose-phosphate aldolase [Haloflavibacter putidus]TQD38702.1 deoxyribose-phosphate aldolase [Haloflavibacter putidus]
MELKEYIDHTQLKPTATPQMIEDLCKEAATNNFYAVCVNGCHVTAAKKHLKNTSVKIAAVVGFPLGAMSTEAKIAEAKICIENGADEVDMVINIGWLKAKEYDAVENDIQQIKEAIGNKVLKVIIETCYLTDDEKRIACQLALNAKADFVKTSTGFGSGGATLHDVGLMKEVVEDKAKIKASGGIRDYATAIQYIEKGVSRIGTSSGIAIVNSKK